MHRLGFTRCLAKHAVFYRYQDHDTLVATVDMDDLTMARNTKKKVLVFKNQLHETFKIKDLGDLHWWLGIEVKRDCEK